VTRSSFDYFFCPFLYKDEDVELCKAHIINQKFSNASKIWTVQRKDVDNFYGSFFEAEFLLIQHKEKLDAFEAMKRKDIQTEVLLNDKPVDYYPHNNNIPDGFTPLVIDKNGEMLKIVVKMPSTDVDQFKNEQWEIAHFNDLRLPAFVSLLKAAHLTLIKLIGYSYVFSKGAHYVGN
jgi:hypothetical protein